MNDVEKWRPEPLWLLAKPLLPDAPQRHQGGGRRRLDDRTVVAAVLYVLRTGCAWSALPASFGISSPTAHRRFAEWVEADVFARLHRTTLDLLGVAGAIDWSRASVDSMHVRAVKGGDLTGPSPVDRGKPGSKIHAMGDREVLHEHEAPNPERERRRRVRLRRRARLKAALLGRSRGGLTSKVHLASTRAAAPWPSR